LPILSIAKIEDDLYSINSILNSFDGDELMVTFDFNKDKYLSLLSTLNLQNKNIIEQALKMNLFRKHFNTPNDCRFTTSCKIGEK
jgi:hypothetical protein